MIVFVLTFLIILFIVFLCCIESEDKMKLFSTLAGVTFVVGLAIVFVSCHVWDKLAEPMKSHEFEITAMSDNHEMYILPRLWK